jgi:GntR family transcriptional regulator/MocR family aminotransferase
MPKQATTFELMLPPRETRTPAYRWLYEALRAAILEGRLRPGARLPGTRDLASQYGLSRGTIVTAFEQLKSEGYVDGSVGSGTYVSKVLPDELLKVPRQPMQMPAHGKRERRVSAYARRLPVASTFDERRPRAFRTDLPALDLFRPRCGRRSHRGVCVVFPQNCSSGRRRWGIGRCALPSPIT